MSVPLLILGLVLFIGLVVVHEWGHFIMARRNGVEAEEFSIFFPPTIFRKRIKSKRGDYNFAIGLLPLGGYVKMKGEHDSDTAKGTFGAASLWAKSKIMAAGIVINLLVCVVLLAIVAAIGMPQVVPNQFTIKSDTHIIKQEVLAVQVEQGSPAAKAGLSDEDQLVAIGKPGHAVKLTSSDQLRTLTDKFAGQKVALVYARKGVQHQATTTLLSDKIVNASLKTNNPKGHLGVVPTEYALQRSTWSAPIVAVGLTGQLTALTFQGLGHAIGGIGSAIAGAVTGNHTAREHGQSSASSQVSGPVGIYYILQSGSLLGYQFILFIVAYISLALAIMNVLPIPALDGGRLWITLFTRGIKKPLTPRREELITAGGFVFLLALITVITIVDVQRFF
jgi:regulator of sigma E protease